MPRVPLVCPPAHPTTEDTMNPETENDELLAEDLIEEVSIDGMCGVY